jgi:hypothetical protein
MTRGLPNMPYFDQANLRRLADGFATVSTRAQALTESFLIRHYVSALAKEYAQHGVCRRLSTLARCIGQIYTLLPPERDEVPPRDILLDVTIFLQAFVFNAFGVLDNLAFVWVNEKNVTKSDRQPLPNGRIGLTRDKEQVRESFSPEMQAYLAERDPWFANLESFRHSLGHRIPLYIPPYIVSPENLAKYESLEAQMDAALFQHRDPNTHERLKAERDALTRFRPWMKHSFNDPAAPIVFHAQILADFATVEEMAKRVLAELDR